MRNKMVIALLFLLVPSCAHQSPSAPDPSLTEMAIRVEGVVTNSKTGAPIAGAFVRRYSVSVNSVNTLQEVTCDGDGKYLLAFTVPVWNDLLDQVMYEYVSARADGYRLNGDDPSSYYNIKYTPWVQIVNISLIPL